MKLSAEQIVELGQILENLESELTADIEQGRKASAPVKLDQQAVGRVSRMDAIQQQQMQLASLQRMEKRLSMVKAAKSRINGESFGICTICEDP